MSVLYLIRLYLITIVVAASYLTLGVFDPGTAEDLWWQYGIVSLVLGILNLLAERWRRDHVH